MKSIPYLSLLFVVSIASFAQAQENKELQKMVYEDQEVETPVWTEEDREYLLNNLTQSREELTEETQHLTEKQWNFKENPDRWSINQIVEHLAIYELIFTNQIFVALQMGEFPQMKEYPADSLFLGDDPNPNKTTDFTKPFSYTEPLGNNQGNNNLIWLATMRDESIEFVKTENRNLRLYYSNFGPNVHQKCMQIFAHTYRHLNQIRKVKEHPDFPES